MGGTITLWKERRKGEKGRRILQGAEYSVASERQQNKSWLRIRPWAPFGVSKKRKGKEKD